MSATGKQPVPVTQQFSTPLDLLIFADSPSGTNALKTHEEADKLRLAVRHSQVRYASSPSQFHEELTKHDAKRFIFCGHGDAEIESKGYKTLCFTSESDGGPAVVDASSLCKIVRDVAQKGVLELVFLNGCDTLQLGEALCQDAGVKTVVCWASKVLDDAAQALSEHFFKAVQHDIDQGAEPNYQNAFNEAQDKVLTITRPGKLANGLRAEIQTYEFRAPKFCGEREVSDSAVGGSPRPKAAGEPRLLMSQRTGSHRCPIPRDKFCSFFLDHLVYVIDGKVERKPTASGYQKVAPTFVLLPDDNEKKRPRDEDNAKGPCSDKATPKDVGRTLLKTASGGEFKQNLVRIWGKAALLNILSPSVEVYAKDKAHCMTLYGWQTATDGEEVPEECLQSDARLEVFLTAQLQGRPAPIARVELDLSHLQEVRLAMCNHRTVLERTQHPWRIAYSQKGRVIGCKLTVELMKGLLRQLGSPLALEGIEGKRFYREESHDPTFAFGLGDYVVIDVEEVGDGFKFLHDDQDKVIVRTINELTFESTYARDL